MKDPNTTHTWPREPGRPARWHTKWSAWLQPKPHAPQGGLQLPVTEADRSKATSAHRDYVAEVARLVDDQSEVLFRLMTAAAQASSGARHIDVTRQAHSLTASVNAHPAVFRIEAITDRPDDVDRAWAYMTGQARCILPTPDSSTPTEWVLALQRTSAGNTGAQAVYTWMDGRAAQPVTEAVVASTLRSLFP